MAESQRDAVPEELDEQCSCCHEALAGIERLLKTLMSVNKTQLEEKLNDLETSSEILLLTYTMNTLFWVYMAAQGNSPKNHPVKRELERVQGAMKRARIISERQRGAGPHIDSYAAKRFVRNALWEADEENQNSVTATLSSARMKRPRNSDLDAPPAKRTS